MFGSDFRWHLVRGFHTKWSRQCRIREGKDNSTMNQRLSHWLRYSRPNGACNLQPAGDCSLSTACSIGVRLSWPLQYSTRRKLAHDGWPSGCHQHPFLPHPIMHPCIAPTSSNLLAHTSYTVQSLAPSQAAMAFEHPCMQELLAQTWPCRSSVFCSTGKCQGI